MWFKLAFVASFVIAAAVAGSTARRATRHHGQALNQLGHEVRGLLIVRAMLGLVFYSALIAWLVWPTRFSWSYLPVPTSLRWLATSLLLPVLVLLVWSLRTLGTNYRGGVGLYANHDFVTTGPYRRVRHPLYVAFILIMLLTLLLSANWVLGLSGLVLVSSIAAARIPVEEADLRERFGDSWDAYRRRVGCLFPRL